MASDQGKQRFCLYMEFSEPQNILKLFYRLFLQTGQYAICR